MATATIENPGTITTRPAMKVTISENAPTAVPEGAEEGAEAVVPDITLTVYQADKTQGNAIILTALQPGDVIVVDWMMGDAYYWQTRTSANNHIIGNPQRLAPGENRIRVDSSAVTEIVVTPNWRWA